MSAFEPIPDENGISVRRDALMALCLAGRVLERNFPDCDACIESIGRERAEAIIRAVRVVDEWADFLEIRV